MYRMTVEAPQGTSEWPLPEWFSKINTNTQVFVSAVKSFSRAYGEVQENSVILVAEEASVFNILVLARRSDAGVANWKLEIPINEL